MRRPLIRAVARGPRRARRRAATVAARFHNALAAATAGACALAAERRGTDTVVLSGGVFQNRRLLGRTAALLADARAAGAHARAAAAERRRHRLRAARRGGRERWRRGASGLRTGSPLGARPGARGGPGARPAHASDPDHLAAVSTLIASEPEDGTSRAGRLGLAWGLGHATTLALFGLPIVLFNAYLPDAAQRGAEALVGLVIMLLAARLLLRWRRGHFHAHSHRHGDTEHRHLHPHESHEGRARPCARAGGATRPITRAGVSG